MSQYQGKHRIDPPRGRHRVWPTERAVAPLFGASGALTAGALAAIFLSGQATPPDDYAIGHPPEGDHPAAAAPGGTSGKGTAGAPATEGAMDLVALLSPTTDSGGCSSCGGGALSDLISLRPRGTTASSSAGGYDRPAGTWSSAAGGGSGWAPGRSGGSSSVPSGGGTSSGGWTPSGGGT